ncbi:hypothetical protein BBJ28_00016794 [Nothophytophthora sp. Chile5]|nr:hypothetical protein BBJ28_00016794 [Nothophytophthora sp. Chile5]
MKTAPASASVPLSSATGALKHIAIPSLREQRPTRNAFDPASSHKMRVLGLFGVLVVTLSAGTAVATEEAAVCNLMCVQGMRCELQQVQCITAPCNPIATCVAVDPEPTCTKKRCGKLKKCVISSIDGTESCISPCSTVRCASGYTCEVEQVQCIKAPCPPVAACNPTKKTGKQSYAQRALRTASNM